MHNFARNFALILCFAGSAIVHAKSDREVGFEVNLAEMQNKLGASATMGEVQLAQAASPAQGNCLNYDPNRPMPRFALGDTHSLIDYAAPIALLIQQHTGWPASVIIAKAALESGWGTRNIGVQNYFGIGCSKGHTYEMFIGTEKKSIYIDRCAAIGQGWSAFSSFDNSAFSYFANVFTHENLERAYRVPRSTLHSHILALDLGLTPQERNLPLAALLQKLGEKKRLVMPPLNRNVALNTLVGNYEGHNKNKDYYKGQLASIINSNDLDRFDRMTICGSEKPAAIAAKGNARLPAAAKTEDKTAKGQVIHNPKGLPLCQNLNQQLFEYRVDLGADLGCVGTPPAHYRTKKAR